MAMEQRTRRRPLTRQEQLVLQERKQLRREKMEQSRELAKGPIDLPFCLLVLLLTAIGLVILLSASFPSAYYEANPSKHNPMYYFERQAVFAVLGTTVMFIVSRFNYQRLRGAGKILLYLSLRRTADFGCRCGHDAGGRHQLALGLCRYRRSGGHGVCGAVHCWL